MLLSGIVAGYRCVFLFFLIRFFEFARIMLPSAARTLLSSVADTLLPGLWHTCSDSNNDNDNISNATERKTLLNTLVHWRSNPKQTSEVTEASTKLRNQSEVKDTESSTPTHSNSNANTNNSGPTGDHSLDSAHFASADCGLEQLNNGQLLAEIDTACKDNNILDGSPGTVGDCWKNLDWCRWPVCMAFYLEQTCPFGESACPDAHASSDFASVINDKGQVRVCFDALGVGGRMCMRKPGLCRFFHAPAHIRYQLLEIRHGNRLCYRPRIPLDQCSHEVVRPSNRSTEQSVAHLPVPEMSHPAGNADLTLSVAIVAALVARLLESRINHTPGAAELVMAALCGDPAALRSLQTKVQQHTSLTPYIVSTENVPLQTLNNFYPY